ncbi:MAG: hypothetical protein WCP77_12340 [Roseococcus sp.]
MATTGALALAPLGEAAAQGNPYCNGQVQAASFYSTTNATSTRSTITYYVIIQSMVQQELRVSVTFQDPKRVTIPGSASTAGYRLGSWGTSPSIQLAVATLANPSGTGGLVVPTDLVAGTRVNCEIVRRSGA